MNIYKASKIVCARRDWAVSNLMLQKILYLAHGSYLAEKGADHPLVNDDFEAWRYGPVIPDLYYKFRVFGSSPIEEYILHRVNVENGRHEDEKKYLEEVTDLLENKTPSQLVSMTHAKQGAWEQCYEAGSRNIIPNDMIFNEYKNYG